LVSAGGFQLLGRKYSGVARFQGPLKIIPVAVPASVPEERNWGRNVNSSPFEEFRGWGGNYINFTG